MLGNAISHVRKARIFMLLGVLGLVPVALTTQVQASEWSSVSINGQALTVDQVNTLQMQLGTQIYPGAYLVDYQSGCWLNSTTGASGCVGSQSQTVHSRYGSGERSSDGSWSHYSHSAGMGVGGTADGCVYAGSWSNC